MPPRQRSGALASYCAALRTLRTTRAELRRHASGVTEDCGRWWSWRGRARTCRAPSPTALPTILGILIAPIGGICLAIGTIRAPATLPAGHRYRWRRCRWRRSRRWRRRLRGRRRRRAVVGCDPPIGDVCRMHVAMLCAASTHLSIHPVHVSSKPVACHKSHTFLQLSQHGIELPAARPHA